MEQWNLKLIKETYDVTSALSLHQQYWSSLRVSSQIQCSASFLSILLIDSISCSLRECAMKEKDCSHSIRFAPLKITSRHHGDSPRYIFIDDIVKKNKNYEIRWSEFTPQNLSSRYTGITVNYTNFFNSYVNEMHYCRAFICILVTLHSMARAAIMWVSIKWYHCICPRANK